MILKCNALVRLYRWHPTVSKVLLQQLSCLNKRAGQSSRMGWLKNTLKTSRKIWESISITKVVNKKRYRDGLGMWQMARKQGSTFFSEPGSDMPPLSMWYLLFANRVRWHHLLIRNICATITLAISWSIYSWLQTRACHPIQLSSCETQTTWVWLSSLQVPPTGLRFGQRYMSIYGDQRTNDLARTSQGKAFILVQRDSTQSK